MVKAPKIKMLSYMLDHEAAVTATLGNKETAEGQLHQLLLEHDLKLAWFQHERLIHLLTMILSVLLFMIAFCLMLFFEMMLLFVLTIVLGVLSAAYIVHYFRMENTVQRAYLLRDLISKRLQTQKKEKLTQENRPPAEHK